MSFLLNSFKEWNIDLYNKMCNTSHHSIEHNYTSPHHGEGSVISHTELVLKEAIEVNQFENCIELEIAALCHDIGKVYTRFWNTDNNKICFYGHEIYSIEDTISFCNYLNDKYKKAGVVSKYHDKFCSIDLVVYLVANHMKKDLKLKEITPFTKLLLLFQNCDNLGRICDNKSTEYNDNLLENLPISMDVNEYPDVMIMSGIPGSGKDTWARRNGYSIISYDDIRVELYKEVTGESYYQNAWNWCNENKIDLNKHLVRKLKESTGKVAICNTNITTKARRKMKNIVKSTLHDISIGITYLWVNKDIAIERDLNRNKIDKSVGERVIDKFYKRQSLPCETEGFDYYNLVINN